jgi:hypothetical protein
MIYLFSEKYFTEYVVISIIIEVNFMFLQTSYIKHKTVYAKCVKHKK